nr:unnamed protein product [Digitaria exilis]
MLARPQAQRTDLNPIALQSLQKQDNQGLRSQTSASSHREVAAIWTVISGGEGGVCHLCGSSRATRRPCPSTASPSSAAAAEGRLPCVVSSRFRWIRSPVPRPCPLTAASADDLAEKIAALTLSDRPPSSPPPAQKHQPAPSLHTPIGSPSALLPRSHTGGPGRCRAQQPAIVAAAAPLPLAAFLRASGGVGSLLASLRLGTGASSQLFCFLLHRD